MVTTSRLLVSVFEPGKDLMTNSGLFSNACMYCCDMTHTILLLSNKQLSYGYINIIYIVLCDNALKIIEYLYV